jgi:hypothetical protein
MLARPPGDVAHPNAAQVQRSPAAARFTRPAWGNGAVRPATPGANAHGLAAHRAHISQRRAVTARGPRAGLAASICARLARLPPPGTGHVVRAGRPVRRGPARFPATRPRCHRSTVPAVTSRRARSRPGMSLISAASTARPAQSHRAAARCGAAPRPRAAARAVPHPRTPANDPAGQASQQAAPRSDRADATTWPVIMPDSHAAPIASGHRHRPASGTPAGASLQLTGRAGFWHPHTG